MDIIGVSRLVSSAVGAVKIIASIEDPPVIAKILEHFRRRSYL